MSLLELREPEGPVAGRRRSDGIAETVNYLDCVVSAGGPRDDQYGVVAAAFDRLHRAEFAIKDGISSRIRRTRAVDDFFDRHAPIFRTTRSMQGFAFAKPHGYAGDFEMIERIYNETCSLHEASVNWDRFFHAGAAPRAVRARAAVLKTLLADRRPQSVLSMGSGPALDVALALDDDRPILSLHLLDNDANALQRAKANLRGAPGVGGEIGYHLRNALRFRSERSFDLVWSAGLFDYLSDRVAIFLLKRVKEMLAPGGAVAVGNFHHDNASRSYMELVGEWFLIHRDEAALASLGKAAGFEGDRMRVVRDQTGLNMFLVAEA